VHEIFQRELPLSALYEANTVARFCEHMIDSGWQPPESGQLVVNPGGTRTPLFGICGIYGHALRLLLLGTALGPDRPFYGLQPPGMDWEKIGCGTIEEMAGHYLEQIRRIQPVGPYQLIGTSFGGVVVFEIALQLQRAGETVGLLAMVDTFQPNRIGAKGLDRGERRDWGANMASDTTVEMGVHVAQTHDRALDKYVLQDRFSGAIDYFWCQEEPAHIKGDRRSLWGSFASEGMRIFKVPGRHGIFHREPQLSAVVDGIEKCLC
jgi:pimeloyl-ACP methyl ester carboxylesterase